MISEKRDISKIMLPIFICLLWETLILFGTFVVFKLVILYVADTSMLSFFVENLRETIREYSFLEFLLVNKSYCLLVSLISIVLSIFTLE